MNKWYGGFALESAMMKKIEELEAKIKRLEEELKYYKEGSSESCFIDGEEYLSTRGLCERYKFLKLSTVRRWISQGEIPSHKLFGKNLIKVSEFEELIKKSRDDKNHK